jgi:hypothetical protein
MVRAVVLTLAAGAFWGAVACGGGDDTAPQRLFDERAGSASTQASTPERTATEARPTATPVPPTATSAPPTATPVPPTSTPATPTATATSGNCDPSYPTVCIPPSPPDLDCPDIAERRFEVLPPDPHRFDGDGNGIGCEAG